MSGIIGEYPRDGKEYDGHCARCGASVGRDVCEECGGNGWVGIDELDESRKCDNCRGTGGSWRCISSPGSCQGNPMPGRESMECGQVEWHVFDGDGEGYK